VVGDSLSISLGEQLEHALAGAPGLDFSRDGQRSTGLSRPELLDWPTRLRELVAKAPPDIVVIMIGANDVMPLTAADGSRVYFDQPVWDDTYAAKARELVAICRQANPDVAVSWVGAPPMGDAALNAGVKRVNAVLSRMCAEAGCRFIDAEAAFSDPEGRYTRHARDAATAEATAEATAIRTADGVHLTEAGARLLAGVTAASLAGKEHLPPAAGLDELRAQARDLRPVADPAPQPQREASGKTKVQAKARPSGKVYNVRDGDTFRLIAKRLGVSEDDLVALNPDADPRRLSIGQPLRLPVRRR
jgi:lysophospholipase L1-like esterase